MSLEKKLNYYTKISPKQRSKAVKWLARQNEELQLVAFEKQKDFLFNLSKMEEKNKSILYLAAYCMAADALYVLLVQKKSKNKAIDIHDVVDTTTMQAKQFKRIQVSEKWNKLLNLQGKIIRLIEAEKLSYREVSRFLKTYHRLEVSHSYIATFYQKYKEEK